MKRSIKYWNNKKTSTPDLVNQEFKDAVANRRNNKLIAEFMEFHRTDKGYIVGGFGDGTFGLAEELFFDTSWDWLMPVIQKCHNEIGDLADGEDTNIIGDISHHLLDCDIGKTFGAVLNAIKWYNENK